MKHCTADYSDTEIRDMLMATERKLQQNQKKLTWWEGNFIDGLCRRNRYVTISLPQKKSALEIIAKYR